LEITLNIPDDLGAQLRHLEMQLPQILNLGLREFKMTAEPGFEGVSEVVEMLAGLPTPEEILALRPSKKLQTRIDMLLEKNRQDGLSSEEEQEWGQYEYLEHLVRLAKANAVSTLKVT
jgi:hypothetical protein